MMIDESAAKELKRIGSLRSDFEISMLFNPQNLPSYAGCLKRNENDWYIDSYIEAAWRGYLMRANSSKDELDRFEPTRNMTIGMVTHFKELCTVNLGTVSNNQISDLIRTSLTVTKNSPI